MVGGSSRGARLSLAGQHLVFQIALLSVVLVAVTAISLAQTRYAFVSEQGRRMLTVAEYTAASPLLRSLLEDGGADLTLAPAVETLRTATGVDQLLVVDRDGEVVGSPRDPSLLGTVLTSLPQTGSDGAWDGTADLAESEHVVARVPVVSATGGVVGAVVAGRKLPTFSDLLESAAPNLLTYLGVAGVLGVIGAWLLAARVKRQTLGLEPDEIGRLVEHREAMLHGIREGVISVDIDGIVTLANESAVALLRLPVDPVGRRIDDIAPEAEVAAALRSKHPDDQDTAILLGDVVLVLSQTTIRPPRSTSETVTTIRDRSELVALQEDLGASLQATDTLRAQTHEFANRLHTISIMLQLGDAEAAVAYIDAVAHDLSELDTAILRRIAEPSVAALLIAKTSLARERGVTLSLDPESSLGRIDSHLAADVVTVVGNLVDNALDAVAGSKERRVTVDLREHPADDVDARTVRVTVRDTGPGVADSMIARVFESGVTTKVGTRDVAGHGFGLAIVQLVAGRRGGRVLLTNDGGAVFTAVIPVSEPAHV